MGQQVNPPAEPANPEILIKGTLQSVPESLFAEITGKYIRKVALKCSGDAERSGFNAQGAKRILCSESIGNRCNDLFGALARFTRKLATTNIESAPILPFLFCRMIGLYKKPGIQPVIIGEIFKRIVTAVLIQNFRGKTQNATGPMQACGGTRSGVEAAVHTMSGLFDDSTAECILFVDADNAFNRLNRQAAPHNKSCICLEVSTFLKNVFKSPTTFYIKQHVIMSREGTTQGDFAAMQMYSIATKPMVYEDETNTMKSFDADDGAGAGEPETVHEWWTSLLAQGPMYGYFPNASKTILLVKSEHYERALQTFAGSGLNATTDATKYLGGYVGSRETCYQLRRGKVGKLITHQEKLSELAKAEPHAAYS